MVRVFQAKLKVNEIITSLMMNYIAHLVLFWYWRVE